VHKFSVSTVITTQWLADRQSAAKPIPIPIIFPIRNPNHKSYRKPNLF